MADLPVRYTCKGPLVLPTEVQRLFFDRLTAGESPALLLDALIGGASAGLVEMEVRVQRQQTGLSLADDLVATLRQRRGCRADLTALITALPVNGQVHEITCPACGNIVSVRRT